MSHAVVDLPAGHSSQQSIAELRGSRAESIRTVLIAHHDAAMIRSVRQALPDENVFVLPVAQSEWDQQIDDLLAAAVGVGASRIVIAGHSSGGACAAGKARTAAPAPPSARRFLSGVLRSQQELKQAREHFAAILRRVVQHKGIARRRSRGDVDIAALFYIQASGVFLKYNIDTQTCSPLTRVLDGQSAR